MWIEQKWRDRNVYHITAEKWDDWIVNAPKNGKPWLINFCNTMYNAFDNDVLCSRTIQNSGCVAENLGDEFNVGFIDYRGGEMVLETYDWNWSRHWRMAPLQIIVKDGKIYQLPQKNYQMIFYAEAIKALGDHAVYEVPAMKARNDLNIYWEYLLRDVGHKKYMY